MALDPLYRQELQKLWEDLERYQKRVGNFCPDPYCGGICCNFELSGMMPFLTPGEWEVILDYLEARGRTLPPLKGLECPFLERGRCQIYEVRPTACRAYFCNLGPAEWEMVTSWVERAKQIGSFFSGSRSILDWFYDLYDY